MRAGASLLAASMVLAASAAAADRKRVEQAVIAGSVYRDSGFALGGAEVEVTPLPEKANGEKPKGKWRTSTNQRGEFAVRVPAGPMRYNLTVKANGYQPQEKPVTMGADERVEFSFILDCAGPAKPEAAKP